MNSLKSFLIIVLAAYSLAFSLDVGKPAPDFSVQGTDGKTYALNKLKGQYVILEWFNPNCPYVKKHYNSKNLPKIQKQAKADKKHPVTWLSINSAHSEHPSFFTTKDAGKIEKEYPGHRDAFVIDETGALGQSYTASATPHIFIINPDGILVYQGGVDSENSLKEKSIDTAEHKYLKEVLFTYIFQDKPVPGDISSTKPIGCSVKYKTQKSKQADHHHH